jgi:hypothetical protein
MQFFTCLISTQALAGKFYNVSFRDGEEMEFVVRNVDDIYEVHGACNVSKKIIYTLPYQTRGHEAQKRSDLISNINCAVAFAVFFSIIWNYKATFISMFRWEVWEFLLSFMMAFILGVVVRRKFYDLSYEATKIFEVFGFDSPENVDLPKTSRKIRRQLANRVNNVSLYLPPWQFRYG